VPWSQITLPCASVIFWIVTGGMRTPPFASAAKASVSSISGISPAPRLRLRPKSGRVSVVTPKPLHQFEKVGQRRFLQRRYGRDVAAGGKRRAHVIIPISLPS
jgi:hypothetical protein